MSPCIESQLGTFNPNPARRDAIYGSYDEAALATECSIYSPQNLEPPPEAEQNGAPSSAVGNSESGGASADPGDSDPDSQPNTSNGAEAQHANLASLLSPDTDWGDVQSDVGALVANLIDETAVKDPTPDMAVVAGGD